MSNTAQDVIERIADLVEPNMFNAGADGAYSVIPSPMPSDLRDVDMSLVLGGRGGWMVGSDVSPEVIWPMRATLGHFKPDGAVVFTAGRSISAREVRGRCNVITRHMMKIDDVRISPARDVESFSWCLSYMPSQRTWVHAVRAGVGVSESKEDITEQNLRAQALIGLAFEHQYEWAVTIGVPNGPSLRFATTVDGIKQMLKERDKGDTGRRQALRAWVSDHWRKTRWTEDEKTYVRKHLRGGEKFSWRGYECIWMPSNEAIHENDRLRKQREGMACQIIRQDL